MTLFYAASSSTKSSLPTRPIGSTSGHQTTSDYVPSEEVQTIDMKHKDETEILREFVTLTEGVQVEPTEEDKQALERVRQEAEESEVSKAKDRAAKALAKREIDALAAARIAMPGTQI